MNLTSLTKKRREIIACVVTQRRTWSIQMVVKQDSPIIILVIPKSSTFYKLVLWWLLSVLIIGSIMEGELSLANQTQRSIMLCFWLATMQTNGSLKINGEQTGDKMVIFILPEINSTIVKLELLFINFTDISSFSPPWYFYFQSFSYCDFNSFFFLIFIFDYF